MLRQLIWADGGLSHSAPRDTIEAYWGALGAGADGLIVGAQLTRDGVVICSATDHLDATTGQAASVSQLTAENVRKLNAGGMFRSMVLDKNNKETSVLGKDIPWQGSPTLYHPTLQDVFRVLGRRTRFIITLGNAHQAASKEQVEETLAVLDQFALTAKTIIAGNPTTLRLLKQLVPSCLMSDPNQSADDAAKQAKELGATTVMVSADRAVVAQSDVAQFLVTPTAGHRALSPEEHRVLSKSSSVRGYSVSAVNEMHELIYPRGLVASDDFKGMKSVDGNYPQPDRTPVEFAPFWVVGHSRPNQDTKIWLDDGLHIQVKGKEYSGAAALTTFSIHGAFDARISFVVENPNQGTTFELAAIQVDAGYQNPNLTFDVHGAPPYASSERDEDDGFRIGWNNGPALINFVVVDKDPRRSVPQSSNLYNNYGRDVGYAKKDSPAGELRLTRNGYVYNAYYRDKSNQAWVMSGSVAVPALADAVFLRLGGKHWPKKGKPAPDNEIKFNAFELRQW